MKLTLEKVRWKNFLATGDSFLEIDLAKSPTTLILGKNGDGKSTFMDAITFALFNTAFRKINKNQLVNSINKKSLVVEVEFATNKHKYLVRRGIKPTVFEIFQDGSLVNQNADSRDYQRVLEQEVLRLNYRTFTQTVVVGSATYVPFMQLTSQHRREVIEDLLDIQIFSVMNVLLKGQIQQNKDALQSVQHKLDLVSVQIDSYNKHTELAAKNIVNLIEEQEVLIADLQQKCVDHEANIVANYPNHAFEIARLESTLKIAEKAVNQCQYRYDTLLRQIQANSGVCDKCGQEITEEHTKEVAAKAKSELEELKPQLREAHERWGNLNSKVVDLQSKQWHYQTMLSTLNDMRNNIAIYQQYIDNLNVQLEQSKQQFGDITETLDEQKQLESEKEALLNEAADNSVAYSLLKDSGIKTRIISQYVPVINKLINKYLAAMDFFVNFELDENFNETIKSRHRDDFSYYSFSEGQKFRIDLAIMFTWRAIAKIRNTTNVNLLILDEVFDKSLDSSGTEEFLKIIHALEQGTNTFVISHRTDQLIDQFSSVIKFKMQKNFSTIVESE